MLDWLLHLWAGPEEIPIVPCPAPTPGQAGDPGGFADPATVSAAYNTVGLISLSVVLLLILICYLWTSQTLGPRFVKRWWVTAALAALLCALIPIPVLRMWDVRAAIGSCSRRWTWPARA